MMTTLYFDIETGPREAGVLTELERKPHSPLAPLDPFDPASVKLGNIKDKDKRAAKVRDAEKAHADLTLKRECDHQVSLAAHEERVRERAALCPTTAEILCIQTKVSGEDATIDLGPESEVLKAFWSRAENVYRWVNWVGHNRYGSNFDLDHIFRRSWALGITPSVTPHFAKSRVDELAGRYLLFADRGSFMGLERAAGQLGFYVEDTRCSGKDFHRWFKGALPSVQFGTPEEQRAEAVKYAMQDVELLELIDGRISA